ncbi:unnamed protein product [Sphagnum jensenii]|uniref:Uncharacterized protein n=1 Tax=Sphagnum jensenii TaxID=128206 RepID=A0ABP1BXQ9_9BRYO
MAPMTSRRPVSAPDDAEELADTSLWQLAGRCRGGEEEVQPASSYQGFSMRAKELVRNSSLSFGPRNHHRGAGAEESNKPDGDHGAAAAAGLHHDGFLSRRRQTSMDISSLEVLITKTGYQEPYYMETMHSPSSEILHPMRSLFLDRISGASPTELPPVRKDKQTEVVSSVSPEEHYTSNTDEHDPSSPPVSYFSEFPELKKRREKIVEEEEEEEEAIVVEPVAAATEQESGEPAAAAGQKGSSGGGDGGPPADAPPSIPNVVVMVVYDAEKKPTTTGLDYAINTIVKEGDEIIVVGYLQHVMSPMGHKMLADTTKFIGVNEKCLKGEMLERKQLVEKMILNSGRGQICAKKKVNLSTRIVPGALPRVIVVQEAESSHATWVIFDRNAMKEKKMYYSEHLKCHVLRIKSDGCSTETIRSLGPTPGPFADSVLSASFTSSESSSSTDHSSISNMSHEFSPSIWSRFKSFGSRQSSSVNHQQSVSATSSSIQSSPRTLVLSSTPEDTEYIVSSIPTINEFSFDSPNQKSMLNSATKLKAFYLGEDANIPQWDGAA